jgi:hypothetical protein
VYASVLIATTCVVNPMIQKHTAQGLCHVWLLCGV